MAHKMRDFLHYLWHADAELFVVMEGPEGPEERLTEFTSSDQFSQRRGRLD